MPAHINSIAHKKGSKEIIGRVKKKKEDIPQKALLIFSSLLFPTLKCFVNIDNFLRIIFDLRFVGVVKSVSFMFEKKVYQLKTKCDSIYFMTR